MKHETIVFSILGTIKDAQGGASEKRWNMWRPTIGLVNQSALKIDTLHLVFDSKYTNLATTIQSDISRVSPDTKVIFENMPLTNPWDFEEVYSRFYDLAKSPRFHRPNADYYIHISTGSHVEKICLFLLAESHLLPGKLIQTIPMEGHGNGSKSHNSYGTINIIDLDLSRYDKLAKRFEIERQGGLSFLKQGIETRNAAFNKLIEKIERVSERSKDPILLMGPTGAGKSQLAKQIYLLKKQNGQVAGSFVSVNCATLGGELAKSALFGYEKGAFTGADRKHDGYLKEADGGILFLDEVGELPLEAQTMLLKAIEEKSFRPLSAMKDEHSDFQLICGTNRDLTLEASEGKFRSDLLARINLWQFTLPGLIFRREDIAPNLEYELTRFRQKTGKNITFNTEAYQAFLAFALDPSNLWPGNFRDLNAMVTRMGTLSEGGRITKEIVQEEIASHSPAQVTAPDAKGVDFTFPTRDLLERVLGAHYEEHFDSVDLVQLAHVISICRESHSAAEAAKKLFAVSRKAKAHANDSDRLTKFLARFNLKFREIIRA